MLDYSPMKDIYTSEFFERNAASEPSAKIILGILFENYRPESLVDVGAGAGAWMRAAKSLGVSDVCGVDGDWAENSEGILRADLNQRICLGRRFDLALCLEVAEHLPENRADTLVEDLTCLSDVVLFSAAIPGQGGEGHVNEQWQSYWRAKFIEHKYIGLDIIRPRTWRNRQVDWWYAQNSLLYVKDGHESLHRLAIESALNPLLDVVHPYAFRHLISAP